MSPVQYSLTNAESWPETPFLFRSVDRKKQKDTSLLLSLWEIYGDVDGYEEMSGVSGHNSALQQGPGTTFADDMNFDNNHASDAGYFMPSRVRVLVTG